jgi:hypothetical protein
MLDCKTLYLHWRVLHHGITGAGQIAKIRVRYSQDAGSAGVVPFLRSPNPDS